MKIIQLSDAASTVFSVKGSLDTIRSKHLLATCTISRVLGSAHRTIVSPAVGFLMPDALISSYRKPDE